MVVYIKFWVKGVDVVKGKEWFKTGAIISPTSAIWSIHREEEVCFGLYPRLQYFQG